MTTGRMEAFSDGVIAILITVMVLELKIPDGPSWAALGGDSWVLVVYLLSFANLGIYWNNHHHLLQATVRVNGTILWANLHLLFWLSLIPFTTAWLGRTHFAARPAAAYGIDLLACALAYWGLQRAIISDQQTGSLIGAAVGRDWKGKGSILAYMVAVGLAFLNHWIAMAIYAGVAVMWFIPDRRIERIIAAREDIGEDATAR